MGKNAVPAAALAAPMRVDSPERIEDVDVASSPPSADTWRAEETAADAAKRDAFPADAGRGTPRVGTRGGGVAGGGEGTPRGDRARVGGVPVGDETRGGDERRVRARRRRRGFARVRGDARPSCWRDGGGGRARSPRRDGTRRTPRRNSTRFASDWSERRRFSTNVREGVGGDERRRVVHRSGGRRVRGEEGSARSPKTRRRAPSPPSGRRCRPRTASNARFERDSFERDGFERDGGPADLGRTPCASAGGATRRAVHRPRRRRLRRRIRIRRRRRRELGIATLTRRPPGRRVLRPVDARRPSSRGSSPSRTETDWASVRLWWNARAANGALASASAVAAARRRRTSTETRSSRRRSRRARRAGESLQLGRAEIRTSRDTPALRGRDVGGCVFVDPARSRTARTSGAFAGMGHRPEERWRTGREPTARTLTRLMITTPTGVVARIRGTNSSAGIR